jgi:putative addiction module killer protein
LTATLAYGNVYVTISLQILEYLDPDGDSPYRDWFESLNAQAAAKVTVALTRVELGNLSNVKGVGAGVQEFRIDFGPGYRVYFGKDGDHLVILLAGGTKSRQQRDIATAQKRWADYKKRKKGSHSE